MTVPVKAGSHMVGATFLATNYRPSLDMIRQYDRKSLENNSIPQLQYYPAIGFLRIQGPFNAQRPDDSRSRRKVFTCRPANAAQEEPCAKQILTTLARRAYRRPVDGAGPRVADELLRGRPPRTARSRTASSWRCGACWRARSSWSAPRRSRPTLAAGQAVSHQRSRAGVAPVVLPVEQHSRRRADQSRGARDRLSNPAVLEQQVRRMLADPRSEALVTNFAAQWLYLRNLPATSPDGVFYPDCDDELRQGFRRETELFFDSIMREDRNVLDLLTADYTFVNERLARHYGIPNVYGSQFRRVTLGPDLDYRRGLLGQGQLSCRSPGRRISGRRRSSAACGCWRTSSARRRRSRRRTCRRSRTRRRERERF